MLKRICRICLESQAFGLFIASKIKELFEMDIFVTRKARYGLRIRRIAIIHRPDRCLYIGHLELMIVRQMNESTKYMFIYWSPRTKDTIFRPEKKKF